MPAVRIVSELNALGVELWAESGQLRFRAPKGLLTEDKVVMLRQHKEQLINLLTQAQDETIVADPQAWHVPFPLTEIQTAYLLGRQDAFGFGGVACHGYLEAVYPALEAMQLEDAWNALIARHDMLRAVFEQHGYQRVLPETPRYRIFVRDLRDAAPAELEVALQSIRREMDHRIYDATRWPLFELRMTRTAKGDVVHFSMDSLVADWASAGILFAELDQILAGREETLPALEIRFRDYFLAERRLREGRRYQRDRRYWLDRVDTLPVAPDLPMLPVSGARHEPVRFCRHHYRLPAGDWAALRQAASKRRLTASSAVLAAYVAVLQRWSRHQHFSLNLTLLNRLPLHEQVSRLVGDFTSVNVLEVEAISGRSSFQERAGRISERLLSDLDHRLFSGVEVLREMARRRGREAALMPVVFTSVIGLGAEKAADNGRCFCYGITQTPQVILDCQVMDDEDGLEVNWDVRQGVFPAGLIEDMFDAFSSLLADLAGSDAAWEAAETVKLPEWQAHERMQINMTMHALPDTLLHQNVIEQALSSPEAIAVIDSANRALTYRDLVLLAASAAQQLQQNGCVAGDKVAVFMEKGIEQVVAVLGVLLAGGVYLPLDTTQPPLRRNKVLADAGIRQVLTQSWVAGNVEFPKGLQVQLVDQLLPAQKLPEIQPGDPDALAYVIYTSGSSGDPKGVMVTHRSALNTIEDVSRRFGVVRSDCVLGIAQLGFDLSVYDIFGPLSIGATLVLPSPDRPADPSHWAALIQQHKVTVWNTVPAQLQMLASYLESEPMALSSLRLAFLSGDWIPVTLPDQIRRLVPGLTLVGMGGATEASIWSNYHRIEQVDPAWTSIPYGVPLANQGFRVLDESMRDVPVWVPGELYITGHGLAAGYLGDPQLTSSRFFNHPVDGMRLYRTGDLGRYLPGGEIEFLGREDNQIKIRGHRIELGEIESALLSHPAVGGAVALVAENECADSALLGFVETARGVSEAEETLSSSRLSDAVARFADGYIDGLSAERVAEYVTALNEAALAAMFNVLVEQGVFGDTHHSYSEEAILHVALVEERHHWLVRQWLILLAEAGWLCFDPQEKGYTRCRAVDAETVRALWHRLEALADGISTPDFVRYHEAHVVRLKALLSNEQNPFELLFPQGNQDVALAIYQDNAIARYNNHAAAALINRIAAQQAEGLPLRVLEIGAGTGATSAAVIPMLEGYEVDYLFTDMTPFFLAEARRRFKDHAWVRFGLLDINEDYRSQGFAPNSVDVVLCAGVLNSTKSAEAAVASIAELLAPGGWLIFTEPTRDLPNVLLTQGFMMDPEGDDRAYGRSKFLSSEQWRQLIEAQGGTWVLSLPDEQHLMAVNGMQVFAARFKTDRQPVRVEALSEHLAQRLPAYMLPAHLQIVDYFPLTKNGKIDRTKLASWRPAAIMHDAAEEDSAPDELESQLCALWADALGIAQIGKRDNFYDKGADSLILARVAGQLRETLPMAHSFSFDTLLRQMLNEPTVAALAQMLRSGDVADGGVSSETTSAAPSEAVQPARHREGSNALIIPFGGGEHGPVRVMFHAALGTMDYFQHLGKALAAQQLGPVIGMAVADVERYLSITPSKLVEQVADDYARRLIDEGYTRFQLVGYCLGGLLATEVARRLLDLGQDVVDLSLVDSIPMFIETDEELAFEAIFVPNLNLDPVKAVFGEEVDSADVYRAIDQLMTTYDCKIPAGAMARLNGDSGLRAVAEAARRQAMRSQDERLAAYAQAAASQAGVPVGPELVPALFRVCRHSMRSARFDPPPYAGSMTFLRCMERQSFGITAGVEHLAAPFWEKVCLGEFNVIDVPGNHFSVVEPPNVDILVDHIAAPLRNAV